MSYPPRLEGEAQMNLIEWFGQFLKWREDQNKRNLLELGEHFGGWLFEQTDADTMRQQWNQMDNAACQQFVDWLSKELTPDGLYIAFPVLLRSLPDPPLNLTPHPALQTAFNERIRQDEVILWECRTGAKGIFLNLPALTTGDIKTVTAFVVPRKEQDSSAPFVYAENFPPDPLFSDSMQRAGKTCVYLLSWRGILWTWAKYIAFGNVFPISLFPVFRDIRRVMHWRRVLSGSHIYVRVDGLNGDPMIDPSIGFEASVAILLALPSISPNTRPKAPLPIQIEHFIAIFTSERINDSAFSGDVEKKGRIPIADTQNGKKILATKRSIAGKAGCRHVFLPKEKSTALSIGVAILGRLEQIVKKAPSRSNLVNHPCASVLKALRDIAPLERWWAGVFNITLVIITVAILFGPLIYECILAPPPYLIRVATRIANDSSGFREGFPQCRIMEHDTIDVIIGGDLGHGLINLSVRAQYGVVFPTMKGRSEWNRLIIPVEKGQATFSYQRNSSVNKDEDILTIIIIRCGKGKGGFPLRLIIR